MWLGLQTRLSCPRLETHPWKIWFSQNENLLSHSSLNRSRFLACNGCHQCWWVNRTGPWSISPPEALAVVRVLESQNLLIRSHLVLLPRVDAGLLLIGHSSVSSNLLKVPRDMAFTTSLVRLFYGQYVSQDTLPDFSLFRIPCLNFMPMLLVTSLYIMLHNSFPSLRFPSYRSSHIYSADSYTQLTYYPVLCHAKYVKAPCYNMGFVSSLCIVFCTFNVMIPCFLYQ